MDQFDKFYLEITKLNYHFKMKKEMTDEYKKIWETIKVFIPIFNRIIENDTINLEELDESTNKTKDNDSNDSNEYNDNSSITLDDLFSDDIFSSQKDKADSKYDTNNNSESNDDEPDVEGDNQVIELTQKNLSLLEKIRNNMWIVIDHCDSDNENDSKDNNNNNDDSNESSESAYIETDDYEDIDLDNIDFDNIDVESISPIKKKPSTNSNGPNYTNNTWYSYLV